MKAVFVIPAKAGIYKNQQVMDPRFRGDDLNQRFPKVALNNSQAEYSAGDYSPAGVSRNSPGATPVHRLKAREKVLGSEKPSR